MQNTIPTVYSISPHLRLTIRRALPTRGAEACRDVRATTTVRERGAGRETPALDSLSSSDSPVHVIDTEKKKRLDGGAA
jgi:hypothetical protein